MYIEDVNRAKDCTLKLSCHDPATKALYDYDVNLMTDKDLRAKVNIFMSQKNVRHFVIIENFKYDRKEVS